MLVIGDWRFCPSEICNFRVRDKANDHLDDPDDPQNGHAQAQLDVLAPLISVPMTGAGSLASCP